jgi:hypothetical protein
MLIPTFYRDISVRWIMRKICTLSDVKEVSISASELVNISKCILPVTEGITRLYQRA